jgi:phospholipid/cholesterol/gamma-HCH transport system permease protein
MRGHESELGARRVVIDMSGITYLDTAGAWIVFRLVRAAQASGQDASLEGIVSSHRVLLDAVERAMDELAEQEPADKRDSLMTRLLAGIGEAVYSFPRRS